MWGTPTSLTWADRKRNLEILRSQLETLAQQKGGLLPKHDLWRLAYYRHPYLIRVDEDYLRSRFFDVTMNLTTINSAGKLSVTPSMENDSILTQKWVHMLEEFNSRGGIPTSLQTRTQQAIGKYFEKGIPAGIRLFKNYVAPTNSILVKYIESKWAQDMYENGSIRISNAGSYKKYLTNPAIHDNELDREFFIPTYREVLDGQNMVEFFGGKLDVTAGDAFFRISANDYYLFCACTKVDFRMPHEFKADAAIVIRDPEKFVSLLQKAASRHLPDWAFFKGSVRYIDPYMDYDIKPPVEMTKSFSFGYQNEFRMAWVLPRGHNRLLSPLYVNIGPMKQYADLISL